MPEPANCTPERRDAPSTTSSTDLEAQHRESDERTYMPDSPRPSESENEKNSGGWDGPDDPANPYNWPGGRKLAIICTVSCLSFIRFVRF